MFLIFTNVVFPEVGDGELHGFELLQFSAVEDFIYWPLIVETFIVDDSEGDLIGLAIELMDKFALFSDERYGLWEGA